MTAKNKWKKLAAVFMAFILVLVVEVGLRFYLNQFPDFKPPRYSRVYDPYRGFYLRPNQVVDWGSSCFDVKGIRINSFGMRDRERKVEKTGPRVALLGDSFLRAFEVNNEQAVNRLLEEKFPGIEFLNFGESGYGTIQSYETYRALASTFKPDLVIYFMHPNDLADNHYLLRAWMSGVPGYVLPGWYSHPDFVRGENGSWTFVAANREVETGDQSRKNFRCWLPKVSMTFFVLARCKMIVEKKISSLFAHESVSSGRQATLFPAGENLVFSGARSLAFCIPAKNKYWIEAWDVTEYSLAELAHAVRGNGSEFLVVGVPDKDILKAQEDIIQRGKRPDQAVDFDPDCFFDRIGMFLQQNDIPFLNLQKEFRKYARKKGIESSLFFYHDCNSHWNEEGHRTAAELVSKFLKSGSRFAKVFDPALNRNV